MSYYYEQDYFNRSKTMTLLSVFKRVCKLLKSSAVKFWHVFIECFILLLAEMQNGNDILLNILFKYI